MWAIALVASIGVFQTFGRIVGREGGVALLILMAAFTVGTVMNLSMWVTYSGDHTAAKLVASDTAVWAVDAASRLAASRSYAAGDELARLRRDAPQTQIGEGANDALLMALAKPFLG